MTKIVSAEDYKIVSSFQALRKQLFETHEKLDAAVRTAMQPVKHSIAVTAE